MNPLWSEGLASFLQVAADTPVVRIVEEAPSILERTRDVAVTVALLALAVLLLALIPPLLSLRKAAKKVEELVERLKTDLAPLVRQANGVAENVGMIASSIKADVDRLNKTIAAGNERLLDAMDAAERRAKEFSALLDVAQQEAEDAFVATASTVRGIREGAAALATSPLEEEEEEYAAEDADVEHDEDDEGSWYVEDDDDEYEVRDGSDNPNAPRGRQAHPRIRRHGRGRA